MTHKNEHSKHLHKSAPQTADEPVEVIFNKIVRLYAENGGLGKNLFSPETEKVIQVEIEALGAYSIQFLQSPAKMVGALVDPAQTEEIRQRALKLYNLILESLPAASS